MLDGLEELKPVRRVEMAGWEAYKIDALIKVTNAQTRYIEDLVMEVKRLQNLLDPEPRNKRTEH